MKRAIFTIANDAYAPQVEILRESLASYDGFDFIWVRLESDAAGTRANAINIEKLLQRVGPTCFQYDITEASTSFKPRVFRALFQQGYDEVVYIDPDICFYSNPSRIFKVSAGADAAVTPHFLTPFRDGRMPDEKTILKSGVYNLGFLYLRAGDAAAAFVEWWTKWTLFDCPTDANTGIFTDQRWCDLIPAMIERVKIIRDPGFNVAYWNLHERSMSQDKGRVLVNGEPLLFFHFSGIDQSKKLASRHSTRPVDYFGEVGLGLLDNYLDKLKANGGRQTPWSFEIKVPYSRNVLPPAIKHGLNHRFKDSPAAFWSVRSAEDALQMVVTKTDRHPVPIVVSAILQARPDVAQFYAESLRQGDYSGLLEWMQNSGPREMPGVERLPIISSHNEDQARIFSLWRSRSDLQDTFPTAFATATGFQDFAAWLITHGRSEAGIHVDVSALPSISGVTALLKMDMVIWANRERFAQFRASGGGFGLRDALSVLLVEHLSYFSNQEAAFLRFAFAYSSSAIAVRITYRVGQLAAWEAKRPTDYAPALSKPGSSPVIERVCRELSAPEARPTAVALYGYVYARSGLGSASRSLAAALESAGVGVQRIALPSMLEVATDEFGLDGLVDADRTIFRYSKAAVELFHCNADVADTQISPDRGQKRVIYAVWEVDNLPKGHAETLQKFDLVITPSDYCTAIFRSAGVTKVQTLHHSVAEAKPVPVRRSGPITFGFFYDSASVPARKAPLELIAAFEAAARTASADLKLIIKMSSNDKSTLAAREIIARVIDNPRIELVFDSLSEQGLDELWRRINVYISLHRAEGFGLTIIEAMARGIPVITTGRSGIVDELPDDVVLKVPASPAPVPPGCLPYPAGATWFEADMNAAVAGMLQMITPAVREAIGGNGRQHFARSFTHKLIGQRAVMLIRGLAQANKQASLPEKRIRQKAAGRVVRRASA